MKLTPREIANISQAYQRLVTRHPELKDFATKAVGKKKAEFAGAEILIAPAIKESMPGSPDNHVQQVINELVTLTRGRPSILVKENDYDLAIHSSIPTELLTPLKNNRVAISKALQGVGRIEYLNHPYRSWNGTGFMIEGPNGELVVVTNRHVAIEMAYKDGEKFEFVLGYDQKNKAKAFLDFKEEVISVEDDNTATVPIRSVLYIEDVEPDLAFLLLSENEHVSRVMALKPGPVPTERLAVATVGYPTFDDRGTSLEVIRNLLGETYGRKRLAPGLLNRISDRNLEHDCATLGGNSGSPLIDLASGGWVGLHFGSTTYPNLVNHAVPAAIVAERLAKILRRRTTSSNRTEAQPLPTSSTSSMNPKPETNGSPEGPKIDPGKGKSLTVEIPIRVTIEVGEVKSISFKPSVVEPEPVVQFLTMESALKEAVTLYGNLAGVVSIRPGLSIADGAYSKERCIVVAMDYKVAGSEATARGLQKSVGEFPLSVRAASLSDLVSATSDTAVQEAVPRIKYRKPADLELQEVDEEMTAIFHASPDAGWPNLQDFLSQTDETLTVGMYNITAPHVKSELLSAVREDPKQLALVLGESSLDDQATKLYEKRLVRDFTNALGERFRIQRADGSKRLFAGHYHIKVAIRDRKSFWLSSGNWENSNQPNEDPIADQDTDWRLLNEHNREWHAIVHNRKLARIFEDYIKYDMQSYESITEAPPEQPEKLYLVPIHSGVQEETPLEPKYFKPLILNNEQLRIQPLLTPDNFLDYLIPLVESAQSTIEIQNQAVKWAIPNPERPYLDAAPRFQEFMEVLLKKQQASPRVKIRFLLRGEYSPEMKEFLVWHGFDDAQVRLINKCHTKGVIIDSKTVLLGSHNLTDHGAMVNRDASLIVYHEEVAKYYRKLFEFDWKRADTRVRETLPGAAVYREGDPVPVGYQLVTASGLPA